MTLPFLMFYILSGVMVGSALMVVTARNPVYSVLFLILAFVNAAGLFLLQGAEFLAMMLIVVYVGAVAILFLFVVMMLDIDVAQFRRGFVQYMPVGLLVGLVLLAELVIVLGSWAYFPARPNVTGVPMPALDQVSNTKAIGQLLYTHYIYIFQGAGLILLVAMIGAIVLTLRQREGVRRQSISEQNSRTRDDAVTVVKVESGEGVSW